MNLRFLRIKLKLMIYILINTGMYAILTLIVRRLSLVKRSKFSGTTSKIGAFTIDAK